MLFFIKLTPYKLYYLHLTLNDENILYVSIHLRRSFFFFKLKVKKILCKHFKGSLTLLSLSLSRSLCYLFFITVRFTFSFIYFIPCSKFVCRQLITYIKYLLKIKFELRLGHTIYVFH